MASQFASNSYFSLPGCSGWRLPDWPINCSARPRQDARNNTENREGTGNSYKLWLRRNHTTKTKQESQQRMEPSMKFRLINTTSINPPPKVWVMVMVWVGRWATAPVRCLHIVHIRRVIITMLIVLYNDTSQCITTIQCPPRSLSS